MKTYDSENVLYQYRFQASEDNLRAAIPYRKCHNHIRKRAIKTEDDESTKLLPQVLYRSGMMVVVGLIYYLVSLAV